MGLFNRGKGTSAPEPAAFEPDVLPAYMTRSNDVQVTESRGRVSLQKAAGISLAKRPVLSAHKFAVYVVGDLSPSMDGYLRDGSFDYLTDAIMALVREGNWDADGVIPLIGYSIKATSVLEIDGDSTGAGSDLRQLGINEHIGGGTVYVSGIRRFWDHYRSSADYGKYPALVFLQSDGQDSNPAATAKLLTELSSEPIHFVLVYYGGVDQGGQPPRDNASSMRELDQGGSMPGRKTDNVSLFIAGPEPKRVTPAELLDGLLEGPAAWLRQAPVDGVRIP